MSRKRLLWQLFPSYLLILIPSLFTIAWYSLQFYKPFFLEEASSEILPQLISIENQLEKAIQKDSERQIISVLQDLEKKLQVQIQFLYPNGKVLDQQSFKKAFDLNLVKKAEIKNALKGKFSVDNFYHDVSEHNMMSVAFPIVDDQKHVLAVLHFNKPLLNFEKAYHDIVKQTIWVGMLVIILAGILSLYFSRRISQPLEAIKRGAMKFSHGELESSILISTNTDEIASVAGALNQMAVQLKERVKTVTEQRNQLEAVLSSMEEGVLAIGPDGKVILLNDAAIQLLRIYQKDIIGKSLEEIVRHTDLLELYQKSLETERFLEGDLIVRDKDLRYLKAHATYLMNERQEKVGVLIVLHDVTKIKRLENLRKDFVANVSHELKTPLTSIKGFVENILEGEIQDVEQNRYFLEIILKQTDRLNEIIEDLLRLSKIERDADLDAISFDLYSLDAILKSAIEISEAKWTDRKPNIKLIGESQIMARLNPRLFEQAIINLIDNAVKYCDPGTLIKIKAYEKARHIVVEVNDQGCGIDAEHLPRLFERFYRVDKARSRDLGGSGLGLAIVKHIIQAHGGSIHVQSVKNQGSTFVISLPVHRT